MPIINPYLTFPGTSEEAFNFYRSVFGGEFSMVARFKDTPEADKLTDDEKQKIMHISLPIGKENVLMASDSVGPMSQPIIEGNNFFVSVHTETKEEADKLFNGLSEGGKIDLPIQDTFWGSYFGMLVDKFKIKWMVSFDKKPEQS